MYDNQSKGVMTACMPEKAAVALGGELVCSAMPSNGFILPTDPKVVQVNALCSLSPHVFLGRHRID